MTRKPLPPAAKTPDGIYDTVRIRGSDVTLELEARRHGPAPLRANRKQRRKAAAKARGRR